LQVSPLQAAKPLVAALTGSGLYQVLLEGALLLLGVDPQSHATEEAQLQLSGYLKITVRAAITLTAALGTTWVTVLLLAFVDIEHVFMYLIAGRRLVDMSRHVSLSSPDWGSSSSWFCCCCWHLAVYAPPARGTCLLAAICRLHTPSPVHHQLHAAG
jgi:hypothetical protein